MSKDKVKISKFLSLVLRHRPELIGIKLDEEGWVPVEALIEGVRSKGYDLDLELLKAIADSDTKHRYALDLVQGRIRANQGHSTKVKLTYERHVPPSPFKLQCGELNPWCSV